MTSHQLAKELLQLPDKQIYVESADYVMLEEVSIANVITAYSHEYDGARKHLAKTQDLSFDCPNEVIILYGCGHEHGD